MKKIHDIAKATKICLCGGGGICFYFFYFKNMVGSWICFCIVCTYLGYALGVYFQDGEKLERHEDITLHCSIMFILLVAWSIGTIILRFS